MAAYLAALGQDVHAEAGAAAGIGREQPAQHADGGGLAASVGAQEAADLAAPYPDVDAVDDGAVAKGLAQALDFDGVGAGFGAHDPKLTVSG